MTRTVTAADALALIRNRLGRGAAVYVAGCAGEPVLFADALREDPDLAAGFVFFGVWIPGVNKTDWAGFHQDARAQTIFLSPDLRARHAAGQVDFLPLCYTQAEPWIARRTGHAAIIQVAPPDPAGRCSLGVSADFSGAAFAGASLRIAHLNPAMPAPRHAPSLALADFDVAVEVSHPLIETPPATLDPAFAAIARNILAQIDDGDTLQFGLGKVQLAILSALKGERRVRIHSGMVSDPILDLLDTGAIPDEPDAVVTGVAVGSRTLYDRLAEDDRVRFAPVSHTHAIATLAAIPRLAAINSVMEVDLFGQANAEFLDGRQISGTGGLVDFLRGAQLSPGGKPIIALAASAQGGKISRITPRLAAPAVSIARADVAIVVTDYGAADLRGRSHSERAHSLIAIAAPQHREELARAWRDMEAQL
jgi:acyl-CoA hydrolase